MGRNAEMRVDNKMAKEKTIGDVKNYVERVANIRNWKLHSNQDGTLDMLLEGLRDNFNRIGYFNCPCRESQENMKLDKDICCPCDYAQPDIEEYGHCYCALYFDPDFGESKPIAMIPERRPEPEM